MIFLTPFMTEEDQAAATAKFLSRPAWEQVQAARELAKLWSLPLHNLPAIDIGTAYEADGTWWEEVEIIATSRFSLKGVRYISNGTLAINYQSMVEILGKCWSPSIDMNDYLS